MVFNINTSAPTVSDDTDHSAVKSLLPPEKLSGNNKYIVSTTNWHKQTDLLSDLVPSLSKQKSF